MSEIGFVHRGRKRIFDALTGFDTGDYISPQAKFSKTSEMARGRTRTRTARRSRRRRPRKMFRRVARSVQPYSIVRKLKTCTTFSLDPAAGAIATQLLCLNSAYDPTQAIGAGQPLGFDQYTSLYQRVAVLGWSVHLQIVSTDNTNPLVVGFCPLVSGSALTSYQHYRELPANKSVIVTPDIDKNILMARGKVKTYFMPKSGRMLSDDTVTHGIGGDPSRKLYGHIYAEDMNLSADPSTVRIVATITQIVCFYVPEVPARS